MEHTWNNFDKFEKLQKYLPIRGEGETIATQASTAINKLVYKWFNDGDVYDNTYHLRGWCNDLSTYANWLYWNIKGTASILKRISSVRSENDYTNILYELCELIENLDWEEMNNLPKNGSVYEETEPFHFRDSEADDWGC